MNVPEISKKSMRENMLIERSMPSIYWWSHALHLQTLWLSRTRIHFCMAYEFHIHTSVFSESKFTMYQWHTHRVHFASISRDLIWQILEREQQRTRLNGKEKDSSYCLLLIVHCFIKMFEQEQQFNCCLEIYFWLHRLRTRTFIYRVTVRENEADITAIGYSNNDDSNHF